MKLLGISPSHDAVSWVLYDRNFDRVFLAGIARILTDDTIGRDLALESWILQVLDQYSRLPGIQEIVLEQKEDPAPSLPRLPSIVRRRGRLWQLKVTELTTPTIRARVTGDGEAASDDLEKALRPRFSAVLDRLAVVDALACALAWTPARFSWFSRR